MDTQEKLQFGYWRIRGLMRHLQYILEYVGAPYDIKFYTQGDGPEFDRSEWMDVKFKLGLDFPNLPHLFHGDTKLAETKSIIVYIAETFKPEILGKTPAEKAKVHMITALIHRTKMNVSAICYESDDKNKFLEAAWAALEPISKCLGDNTWFVGETPTVPDFYIVEFLNLVNAIDGGSTLEDKFPNLISLANRVREVEEIKRFLESERLYDLPFNNKSAKINP